MAGRPPKPAALRVVEGNPGKRPIPREPEPSRARPTRPAFLRPEAKREWTRLVPQLEALGVLATIDRGALAIMCELWADVVELTRLLATTGRTTVTHVGNLQQHPLVAQRQKAIKEFLAYAGQFGLTPSARVKLAGLGENEKVDEFEEFCAGRKKA